MVGHEHEGMDLIAPLLSIFIEEFEKEPGVGFDLKKEGTVGGNGSEEVGAEFLRGKVVHVARLARRAVSEKMTIVRNGPGLKPGSFVAFSPRPEGRGFC